MVSRVTFSPTVTEKGSRSRHWFPVEDEKVAESGGSQWLGEQDGQVTQSCQAESGHRLAGRVGKEKPFFCWPCCCEVVSLDLLGSRMEPESIAHVEGSKAGRWRVLEGFGFQGLKQTVP